MNTYQFKTNFKCQGCADKVGKELDKNQHITSWKVDLDSVEKILTIETSLSPSEIQNIIEKIGYKAEIK